MNETDKSNFGFLEDSVVDLLGTGRPRSVLFMDKHAVLGRSLKRTLAKSKISTAVAQSPADAIEILKKDDYAVVMASTEPEGLDFLEETRSLFPKTNRIVFSGRPDLDATLTAINKIGVFSYVVLPWEPDELREKMRQACDNYSLKIENEKLGSLLGVKAGELRNLASKLETEVQIRTTSLLLGLNAALDLRDTETQWHSRRVALYAQRLAEQMKRSREDIVTIKRGSLLHDIGKIGVSDTILLKPAKLTPEEWEEMKKHAENGYRILEGIDFLGDARIVVWHHHERWDGKGYPQSLAGEDIHIGARIFAVIDTYDAITSDRPYRKGRSHEVANEEIMRCTGVQFDRKVVDAWMEIDKEEIHKLRNAAKETTAGMD